MYKEELIVVAVYREIKKEESDGGSAKEIGNQGAEVASLLKVCWAKEVLASASKGYW